MLAIPDELTHGAGGLLKVTRSGMSLPQMRKILGNFRQIGRLEMLEPMRMVGGHISSTTCERVLQLAQQIPVMLAGQAGITLAIVAFRR